MMEKRTNDVRLFDHRDFMFINIHEKKSCGLDADSSSVKNCV